MVDHGFFNELVDSTNELFNEALQIAVWPNVILLRLYRVNNYGRQNGASFDYLIESRMLMEPGRSIMRAADLYPLATTAHDEMEEEVETATTTFINILRRCEDLNTSYEEEYEFSEIAMIGLQATILITMLWLATTDKNVTR